MPIGLSDDGVRLCDVRARDLLRPHGAASSVFPTPVRAVLATDDYAEARALSRAATDPPRAPSAQSFQLVKAIRSLDDALGEPPAAHVHEVHPELAFRALDPELGDAKVTARGMARRLAALRTVMDVDAALLDAPPRVPAVDRSEEHTSELQSRQYLACRLLLEKKKIAARRIPSRPRRRHTAHLCRRFARLPSLYGARMLAVSARCAAPRLPTPKTTRPHPSNAK